MKCSLQKFNFVATLQIDECNECLMEMVNGEMSNMTVKCRKCRFLLFSYPEVDLLTAHGESYGNVSVEFIKCETIREDNVWFLSDGGLPDWITKFVNEANWTKGKVNCPKCNSRLGSFDFVSGNQCQCSSHTLPPIHIVKCKVDCRQQKKIES